MVGRLFVYLGALTLVRASAPAGPWDAFNYAPKSRTVSPTSVKEVSGTVHNVQNLVSEGSATIIGKGSWVALDFGIEVSNPYCSSSARRQYVHRSEGLSL